MALTTAEIHYCIPDHPQPLQLFVWQEYDVAPLFRGLKAFLEHWQRELEGALHSVRIAHTQLPAKSNAGTGSSGSISQRLIRRIFKPLRGHAMNANHAAPNLERPAIGDERCGTNGIIVMALLYLEEGGRIGVLIQNQNFILWHDALQGTPQKLELVGDSNPRKDIQPQNSGAPKIADFNGSYCAIGNSPD